MSEKREVIFREVQRPNQFWLRVVILLSAIYIWYWFIQQIILDRPFGDNPAPDKITILFWTIFGVLLPTLTFGIIKLVTEVRKDGLYIRFFPFHIKYKQFSFTNIQDYESINYSSLKRFGGWGIRVNFKGERVYNISGNEGIVLKLKHEEIVIIGTKNPQELKEALDLEINIK